MLRSPRPGARIGLLRVPSRGARTGIRHRTLAATGLAIGLVLGAASLSGYVDRGTRATAPLRGAAVALDADGTRVVLPVGASPSRLLPGSRVLAGSDSAGSAEQLAVTQRAWLDAGTIPGAGTRWASMTREAMLDLLTLTPSTGGTAASWRGPWRHVWPRDASFVAVAFAQTGHLPDAERELAYLQAVQEASGLFEARYLLDGSGPPDERWMQSDGSGWVLWATAQVLADVAPDAAVVVANRLRPLIDRSTALLLDQTDDGRTLPPPSPDYRELPEDSVTLGIAGPFLAGLQAATPLARLLGDTALADRTRDAAARFGDTVADAFGPDYPRTVSGTAGDAAVTFLLPPFTTYALPGSVAAAAETEKRIQRPGGGLAPGTDWRDQSISWTPETALFALTAAGTGDRTTAEHWLDWLDAHRTSLGALPEKVNADGTPAGVAPLAWTAALVLLTVQALDHPS